MTEPGRFVVLEGLDGSGTTTQCELLASVLRDRGRAVEVTGEPTTGPFGAVLRQVIEGRVTVDAATLAAGFAADRLDHVGHPVHGIAARLAAGTWVVCDRYLLSSMAYQGSHGVGLDHVVTLNTGILVPDLTVFLDVSPATCAARIAARGRSDELFDRVDVLARVDAAYRSAIAMVGVEHRVAVVDAEAGVETVAAAVSDLALALTP